MVTVTGGLSTLVTRATTPGYDGAVNTWLPELRIHTYLYSSINVSSLSLSLSLSQQTGAGLKCILALLVQYT